MICVARTSPSLYGAVENQRVQPDVAPGGCGDLDGAGRSRQRDFSDGRLRGIILAGPAGGQFVNASVFVIAKDHGSRAPHVLVDKIDADAIDVLVRTDGERRAVGDTVRKPTRRITPPHADANATISPRKTHIPTADVGHIGTASIKTFGAFGQSVHAHALDAGPVFTPLALQRAIGGGRFILTAVVVAHPGVGVDQGDGALTPVAGRGRARHPSTQIAHPHAHPLTAGLPGETAVNFLGRVSTHGLGAGARSRRVGHGHIALAEVRGRAVTRCTGLRVAAFPIVAGSGGGKGDHRPIVAAGHGRGDAHNPRARVIVAVFVVLAAGQDPQERRISGNGSQVHRHPPSSAASSDPRWPRF